MLRRRSFVAQCVCCFPRLLQCRNITNGEEKLFFLYFFFFYPIFLQENIYFLGGTRHLVLMLNSFQKCQVMIRSLVFIFHWGSTSNWKTSKNFKMLPLAASVAGFFCLSVLGKVFLCFSLFSYSSCCGMILQAFSPVNLHKNNSENRSTN